MAKKKLVPVTWRPLMSDMLSFKKSLDQQFDNFFFGHPFAGGFPSILGKGFPAWKPEVDMYETDKEVIVKADIPGCEQKDLNVKIDNNILTISGNKKEEKEVKKRDFYHKEQHMGSFSRSMTLPNYADIGKSKADYKNGVLKIIFPKTKQALIKRKKIEISGK